MPSIKTQHKPQPRPAHAPPQMVSGRWLLSAGAIAVAGAGFCAWAVLCLLFWQGSWQLLYRPASAVTRTPADLKLGFDAVGFAATETGAPQLQGWWISAGGAHYTILFLHGQDGNLSNTLDNLESLHAAQANVFAFDYRGYGQSLFAHPSEARWREDAESALQYLTGTRHIDAHTIILDGSALGANLALEVAAAHPELAGVILESPLDHPADAIFNDPRARMVPAHLLVGDRYDALTPATKLRIPSLWFYSTASPGILGLPEKPEVFQTVKATKNLVWLTASHAPRAHLTGVLSRWLSGLSDHGSNMPACQLDDGFAC
jgi:uncharacterized protein